MELEADVSYQPIPMVARDAVLDEKEAVITGWGLTDNYFWCLASETLQQVSVPIVSNHTCREAYSEETITDNMVCAGYSDGGKDTCHGDSGGPLMVQDGDTWHLAGITSWGQGCAEPGYYGVYTRISQFTDFIYEYMSDLSIALPERATEGDGLLSVRGSVNIEETSDTDLVIHLSSDKPLEITIPTTVTIPAGRTSAEFDITVLDDSLLNGVRTVTVTASDPNEGFASAMIKVNDNETAVLNISVPENAAEGDGVLSDQGLVTVSAAPDCDILVFLSSDDTTEVSVPATVTIPAGETSATFDISILYDGEADGTQTAVITASVPGWTAGTDSIDVLHNEIDFFTEWFEAGDDLAFQTLIFTPDGSGNFYTACREAASDFLTDPAGGTPIDLGDDDYEEITLAGGAEVFLYGVGYSSFYIGSNGYITFGQGDDNYGWDPLSEHFGLPRISAIFTDLYPTQGTIMWEQRDDRVVVTYQDIPKYLFFSGASPDTSSFQIEMFFNGVIRITYLDISANDGIAGLSEGNGIPEGFFESDLSSYGPCGPSLLLEIPETAAEGDGLLTGKGIVSTDAAPDKDLWVGLISDDTSELTTVPAGITVSAGSTSAAFDIKISDDSLLDGTQTVTLTASATGYYDGRATIRISDNETAELTVSVPERAVEGDGVLMGQGTVTFSRPADDDITISLASDDTTEVTVPETVIIPAGETTAMFDVTIIYDGEADGTRTASVTASVPGWTAGGDTIEVLHNEIDFLLNSLTETMICPIRP